MQRIDAYASDAFSHDAWGDGRQARFDRIGDLPVGDVVAPGIRTPDPALCGVG
jgi:hypothetical protein